ncbi:MAG: 2-oxo acid dehydrogenase subunit E2, partial [Rubrivivax sp.]|nr:2-oxo acid dehydrogenase subunit E2 [Rubrivivax sp.]
MIRFELPSLGADMDEGTLLEWRVKPGDTVERGQVVAVVDTSKAAVDVEIWHDGVVAELLVEPGQKIPVGTLLATLLAPGESPTAATAAAATPAKAAPAQAVLPPVEHLPQPPSVAPAAPAPRWAA